MRTVFAAPALALAGSLMTALAGAQGPAITAAEAREIATDAYVFGYPLVTMEMTRRVITNVEKPEGTRAPMGHLIKLRAYPDASFRDVTAPNADTLYTTAFFDVGREPWVISIPDMHDRYFLFPMLDGWTDVFEVPGKRTTGTGAQTYAITGPGWTGSLPAGVKEYKSPTSMVWLLGRIYCTGTPEDYAAVHKLQDDVKLMPLSAWGRSYTPPAGKVDPSIDMKKPVRDQVNGLSVEAYFDMLASLMKDNPAAAADAPMLARMAKLGIVPGKKFDAGKLAPEAVAAIKDVPKEAFGKIMGWFKAGVASGTNRDVNGWLYTTHAGTYGTEYLQRALVTAIGLGANRPQDAIYPTSEADASGKPYMGAEKYVLHFNKGEFPPVDGFWSLTMYNGEFFFSDNALNRYTLSSRNAFKTNADGSVDLYLQHENPGPDKEANWLPAPKDRFILMMRLYWPKETPPSIIDGSWKIPAVVKVK